MEYSISLLRILYGLLGLCVGSFLCLCAYRLPRDMSILWPGSHCDHCGHALGPLDLVPLLSYALHKGCCRYCGEKVPPRYFWRELETCLLFLALGWNQLPGLGLLARFLLISSLLLTSWLDAEEHMIYDVVLGIFGIAIVLQHFVLRTNPLIPAAGALAVGCFMGFIYKFHKNGMGLGDIAFGALLGLWLGPVRGLGCIFLAALLALLYVLGRIGCGDRDAAYRAIPFSPFLVLSALMLSYFPELLPWHQSGFSGVCFLGLAPLKPLKERVNRLLKQVTPFQPKEFMVLALGSHQMDLLEFTRTGEKLQLVRQGEVKAELLSYTEEQLPYWAEKLQALYAKKGFRARNVAAALPWEDCQLRLLTLPGMKKRERLEAARWELQQDLPYEQGSFALAGAQVPGGTGDTAIAAIAAAKLAFVRRMTEILGWRLLKMEPAVTSWGRWLAKEPTAFCLAGSPAKPYLTAYAHGCPLFTECLEPEPFALETGVAALANKLIATWKMALHWDQETPVYLFAPQIWPEELPKQLAQPVKWVHGEQRIQLAEYYRDRGAADSRLWPGAWGTALSGEPGEGPVFRMDSLADTWQLWGPGLGKTAVAFTAAACVLSFGYKTAARWQWEHSMSQNSQLQGWQECWQQWLSREQAIRARSQVIQAAENQNLPWGGFFLLLGRLVPADCWVTHITQEKPVKGLWSLHMEGKTLHKDSALQLIHRLKQHPMIAEAKLEKLQQDAQKQTAGFNIFLTVKGGEAYGS